ncbi:hypothetical protein CDAR_271951 [Caerostris darwini]|uniref:Uncharacterized protein n=1 Tax=Caerostris darwini TaxID=1538125 RepID=A0AAV4W875_9ARAC|nr:hypothetical protein CDAR_271951 [Caerostris darwini]
MSGHGSPPPDVANFEKMDLSLQGDEEKRLNETTPLSDNTANVPPPEVTDDFLYTHLNEMIEIIDLKSKLIADWFRPTECLTNPELCQQYDQSYAKYQEQLDLKCKKLGISHNDVPATIIDLKDRIEYLHVAKRMATTAPNAEQQQQTPPAPPKRSTEKRPLDADGFRLPAKHLTRRITSTAPYTAPKNLSQKLIPKPGNIAKSRTQLHQNLSQRASYADKLVNKPQPVLPQQPLLQSQIVTSAPPPMGERNTNNSAFSSSALELFKTLSVFAHDETLNFPILLKGIRSALPILHTIDNDEEKAITIFEHFCAHYNNNQIQY